MTRLAYLQFTLFMMMLVAYAAAPGAIDPARGRVIAVRALRDGTALVAWSGDMADYVTHVRADGTVMSAEIARERIDSFHFAELDEPARAPATYKGQRVVMRDDALVVGDKTIAIRAMSEGEFVPAWLEPLAGELPQFVGIETEDGACVVDLETGAVVWHGDLFGFVLRDGPYVYTIEGQTLRVFDRMTFSMTLVAREVREEQIGGGYVWTYDHGEARIDAPIVHALRPTSVPVTASR